MINKKNQKNVINVFIASPGDLSEERQQFREAIELLNSGFTEQPNTTFEALGWEDTLANTGRRNQGVINRQIDTCDVFFLVMHRRWGQVAPDSPYDSYTEEEFHRALDRFKKTGTPEIFVFFKPVDPVQEADAGPQLKKVLEFRRHLEDTRHVRYRYIEDKPNSFTKEVNTHLNAFAKGELSQENKECDAIVLPLAAIEEVKKANAEIKKHKKAARDAQVKLEELHLDTAEDAAVFALKGSLEHARQKFLMLVSDSFNTRVLFLAYEFFYRTGDLVSAKEALENWLKISDGQEELAKADIYGNLGNVHQTQGNLKRAFEFYQKSLTLYKALNIKEGMATIYCNLGTIYQTRQDISNAEKLYLKSLEIAEEYGNEEGMANAYGNLGNVYQIKNNLEQAAAFLRKSLKTNKALGHKEKMAYDYDNLGIVYHSQGDLKKAENFYQASILISEEIGCKETMANAYGNLGIANKDQGHVKEAITLYQKSLGINESIGRSIGIAIQNFNLGNAYEIQRSPAKAIEFYQKALMLFKSLDARPHITRTESLLEKLTSPKDSV